MYIDDIGTTAGTIWGFLVKRGKVSLSALEKGVGTPRNLVYMALGWLAREGKVFFSTEHGSTQIGLRR